MNKAHYNNQDSINSTVFEERRDCWRRTIMSSLPPFAVVFADQIDDAADELADRLYSNVRDALRAQGVKL